jgi:hypothetical protein
MLSTSTAGKTAATGEVAGRWFVEEEEESMACPLMGLWLRVPLAFVRGWFWFNGEQHSSKRRRRGRIAAAGRRVTHGGRER